MNAELKDLVIGRKYRIKPEEWFKNNNPDDYYSKKALGYVGKEMILHELVNGSTLVFREGYSYSGTELWLNINDVEEVSGQPNPSKQIIDAIDKLREENYIYGYDGGPGGGGGGTIDTQKEHILPVLEENGSQSIYIQVSSLKRTFTIDKINELFSKGETSQSFEATKYTTIRTDLKLIKDKSKLPERSSWETMRD